MTADRIHGVVWFSKHEVPMMLQGRRTNWKNMIVKFDTRENTVGTHATNMQFALSKASLDELSQEYWGIVRRYNSEQRFGFAVAPHHFEGDVYFQAADLHPMLVDHPLVGLEMGFELAKAWDGRRATNIAVIVTSATVGGAATASMRSRTHALAVMPTLACPMPTMTTPMPTRPLPSTARSPGTVKSFSVVQGWGFLIMEGSDADVYFKTEHLYDIKPAECVPGVDVRAEVVLVNGKPQGRHIQRCSETRAWLRTLVNGTIKSY